MSDPFNIPTMVMIGSAGRNLGKTELACALIREVSTSQDVIGLKVTAVDKADGTCPRGGKGCGVCSSLTGPYLISEEFVEEQGKDTTRLLQAGAARVFWLRVLRSHLEEGWHALIDTVGRDTISVCESNTSRNIITPGLFLMVRNSDNTDYKASAAAVAACVDRTLTFDGNKFTPPLTRISSKSGHWILKEEACAIVLAGGNSSRMKEDKAMLIINGKPMIQIICDQLAPHFDALLISTNDPGQHGFLGYPTIEDQEVGQGPMMGIRSALAASKYDSNFLVACDIPDIDMHFMHHLLDQPQQYDAIVPRSGIDKFEPLFAVYRKSILPHIDKALADSRRSIRSALELANVSYIDLPPSVDIPNLNSPDEYKHYTKD